MAQELDLIVDMLREMKLANSKQTSNFDKLLSGIDLKVDKIGTESVPLDVFKAYISDLVNSTNEKCNTTMSKFSDIESALRAIFTSQDDLVKTSNLKELYDVFTKSINNLYSEALQQKTIITGMENRIMELSSNKTDKEDIIRTVNLLRNDFENVNRSYKDVIDSVNSQIKSIITGMKSIDQTLDDTNVELELEKLRLSVSDMVSFLKTQDERTMSIEHLLNAVATNEGLKLTHSVIEAISDKTEDISFLLSTMANKKDFENVEDIANKVYDKMETVVTKEKFDKVSTRITNISDKTEDIKQVLAKLSKDIESLPDVRMLEDALHSLFKQLDALSEDLKTLDVSQITDDLGNRIDKLSGDIEVVGNIISDVKDLGITNLMSAIESIPLDKEADSIIDAIKLSINELPHQEDISQLLENGTYVKDLVEDLNEKSSEILNKIENVSEKEAVQSISDKADEINEKLDNMALDQLFGKVHESSDSIRQWLEDANLKENTQNLVEKSSELAEKSDILRLLKATEKIVDDIDELSHNADVKKVNRTVSELYRMIEELKNDFINTTEMHNDSILVNLSELQNVVSSLVTEDDFSRFVEDLKSLVQRISDDHEALISKFTDVQTYQNSIIEKVNNINTSIVETMINNLQVETESKLTTLTKNITSFIQSDIEDIKISIADLMNVISEKGITSDDTEGMVKSLEQYLSDMQALMDSNSVVYNEKLLDKLNDFEELFDKFKSLKVDDLENILARLDSLDEALSLYKENASDGEYVEMFKDIQDKLTYMAAMYNQNSEAPATDNSVSAFIPDRISELKKDITQAMSSVSEKFDVSFENQVQVFDEKLSMLSDLVKDLHSSSNSSSMNEKLAITGEGLSDCDAILNQILDNINEIKSSGGFNFVEALEPIKIALEDFSAIRKSVDTENLRMLVDDIHKEAIETFADSKQYTKESFEKAEELYNKITEEFSCQNASLKDFVIDNVDTLIVKVDDLKSSIEGIPVAGKTDISVGDVNNLKEFSDAIADFRQAQMTFIQAASDKIQDTVIRELDSHQEELKSLIALSTNQDEILEEINKLKEIVLSKTKEISQNKDDEELSSANSDEFESNQYEKMFEADKNTQIINDLKADFTNFAVTIDSLSDENKDIKYVLDTILSKIENVSLETRVSEDGAQEDVLVGDNGVEIVKALDLLRRDIKTLHNEIRNRKPMLEASSEDAKNSSEPDEAMKDLINGAWLNQISEYIAGSEIKGILDNIYKKIEGLEAQNNSNDSEMIAEIKAILERLNLSDLGNSSSDNNEIVSILNTINTKFDLAIDNSDLENTIVEGNNDVLSKLDVIDKKIDIISETEDDNSELYETLEEIKAQNDTDSLNVLGALNDTDSKLSTKLDDISVKLDVLSSNDSDEMLNAISDTDTKISQMLATINKKVDVIAAADDMDMLREIDDVRELIESQMNYIERLEQNDKTEAFKKCLDEISSELTSGLNDNSQKFESSIKEIKSSIMSAVLSMADQISFTEDAEEIKGFVEEKTDEINKNLFDVTKQLKQITSSENSDYVYSMQDIESDLTKLRLVLKQIQETEQVAQAEKISSIISTINSVGETVQELQSSLSQDEMFGLQSKFDEINTEVSSLRDVTTKLLEKSGESSKVLTEWVDTFGTQLTEQLAEKVDNMSTMLQNSNQSDKVMRQALIYIGEWIDSASESMNKISSNSEEIVDIKSSIDSLKEVMPEQTSILSSLEEKFDEQQERLSYLEKQLSNIENFEAKFDEQQERIDRLEMALGKILSVVEDLDDSKVTRKIDKIDKQLLKLTTNIEKIASYVD